MQVTIWSNILQPHSHDLLSDDFFEMTWHDGIQYRDQNNVGQIFQKKKNLFWEKEQLRPNLGQNYATFYFIICSLRIFWNVLS